MALRWRVVPTVFSKFHAAFTQGSEPDSLLLALHPGLDVFPRPLLLTVQSHTGFMEFPATEGAGAMCCH